MFKPKVLIPYFAIYLLRFLLVFGVIIAAAVAFLRRPSVLTGLIVFFALLYRYTLGRRIDDALIMKSMRMIRPVVTECMKKGTIEDIRAYVRLLKTLCVLSIRGFEYGLSHQYQVYTNSTLLNPAYVKKREWLWKMGRKHMNSDDYIVISEFYQYAFFQHCILGEKDLAVAFLRSLLEIYVPLDAKRFSGAEVFHQFTNYPTFTTVDTSRYQLTWTFGSSMERMVKLFRPRFEGIHEYLLDPSDEKFAKMKGHFQSYYLHRRAMAYRALMEIALWANRKDHAANFKDEILKMESDLPVVVELKRQEAMYP